MTKLKRQKKQPHCDHERFERIGRTQKSAYQRSERGIALGIREIRHRILKSAQTQIGRLGVGVLRKQALDGLMAEVETLRRVRSEEQSAYRDIQFLLQMPSGQAASLLSYLGRSAAQFRQDLFVLSELNFKREGFFVEFGATDGVTGSNTYMLEKDFGWKGILCEPARSWHRKLHENRSVAIETRCVWTNSGESIEFNEVCFPELSTIGAYSSSDDYALIRERGTRYDVETISLVDLLEAYGAPREIDYLSIDTEGSEHAILQAFDFRKYEIKCITVEHNHTPMREQLCSLLTSAGYERRFQNISHVDDWYVRV
jgi:FkbM family methyltransferase